jgi:hypothetical protein
MKTRIKPKKPLLAFLTQTCLRNEIAIYCVATAIPLAALLLSVTLGVSQYLPSIVLSRLNTLRAMLATLAAVFASLAAGATYCRHCTTGSPAQRLTQLAKQVKQELVSIRGDLQFCIRNDDNTPLIFLTTVTAAVVRLPLLINPMQYDEAFTITEFATGPFYYTFFYPVPNNHVLHTVLVRIAIAIGGDSPPVTRLPAFLSGLAVLPATFLLARSLGLGKCSIIPPMILCFLPHVILYDTMARGYSLQTLITIVLAGLALRSIHRSSIGLAALIGATCALGMFDLPSFLFSSVAVFVWWLAVSLRHWPIVPIRQTFYIAGVAIGIAGFLTGTLYGPVIFVTNGIAPIVSNPFVASLSSADFFTRLPLHVADAIKDMIRGLPVGTGVFLGALIAGQAMTRIQRRPFALVSLLPAFILGCALVLVAKHAIPFSRTWIFLTPILAIVFSCIFWPLEATMRRTRTALLPTFFAVLGILAYITVQADATSDFSDTGVSPGAEQLSIALRHIADGNDAVVASIPLDAPLRYYLKRNGSECKVVTTGDMLSGKTKVLGITYYAVQSDRYSLRDICGLKASFLFEVAGLLVFKADSTD